MNTDIQPPKPLAPAAEDEQAPVADAPVAAPPAENEPTIEQATNAAEVKRITPPKPKQPGNGVSTAIAATVIIVLGLAALATYAYLKTR